MAAMGAGDVGQPRDHAPHHRRRDFPHFATGRVMDVSNPRWTRRPAGSTWGDWGPDDQLGRLNLLTAAKVKQGVAEVTEGKTFCLSLPLDYPGGTVVNPRRHPPRLIANKRDG